MLQTAAQGTGIGATIAQGVIAVVNFVKAIINTIIDVVKAVMAPIIDVVKDIFGELAADTSLWEQIGNDVGQDFANIGSSWSGIFSGAFTATASMGGPLAAMYSHGWQLAMNFTDFTLQLGQLTQTVETIYIMHHPGSQGDAFLLGTAIDTAIEIAVASIGADISSEIAATPSITAGAALSGALENPNLYEAVITGFAVGLLKGEAELQITRAIDNAVCPPSKNTCSDAGQIEEQTLGMIANSVGSQIAVYAGASVFNAVFTPSDDFIDQVFGLPAKQPSSPTPATTPATTPSTNTSTSSPEVQTTPAPKQDLGVGPTTDDTTPTPSANPPTFSGKFSASLATPAGLNTNPGTSTPPVVTPADVTALPAATIPAEANVVPVDIPTAVYNATINAGLGTDNANTLYESSVQNIVLNSAGSLPYSDDEAQALSDEALNNIDAQIQANPTENPDLQDHISCSNCFRVQ